MDNDRDQVCREIPGMENALFLLVDGLHASHVAHAEENFREFLRSEPVGKYLVVSDYCMDDSEISNDAAVFVVVKGDNHFPTVEEVAAALPVDLKNAKVDDVAVRFLNKQRFFTFAFVFDKKARLLPDPENVFRSIDATIQMLSAQKNPEPGILKRLRHLRRLAQDRKPIRDLYERMMIISTVAAWIFTLILREVEAEQLGWFSDRDKITTTGDHVVKALCFQFLNDLCVRSYLRYPVGTGSAIDPPPPPKGKAPRLWYDAYLRLADYLAAPIANLTLASESSGPTFSPSRPGKHTTILTSVVADNPRVSITRLRGPHWPFAINPVRISNPPLT